MFRKMKVLIGALLLALVLIASATAFAAETLEVNGVDMLNGGTVPGVTYDAATKTLTLDNATISNKSTYSSGIYSTLESLTIMLKGRNKIDVNQGSSNVAGINTMGTNLYITSESNGSLEISLSAVSSTDSKGIHVAAGNVLIENCTISINGTVNSILSFGLSSYATGTVHRLSFGSSCNINISLKSTYGSAILVGDGSGSGEVSPSDLCKAIYFTDDNILGFYDGSTKLELFSSSTLKNGSNLYAALGSSDNLGIVSGTTNITNGAKNAVLKYKTKSAPPSVVQQQSHNPGGIDYTGVADANAADAAKASGAMQQQPTAAPEATRNSVPMLTGVKRENGGATFKLAPSVKGASFLQTYGKPEVVIGIPMALKGRDPNGFYVTLDGARIDGSYYKNGSLWIPISDFGEYEIVYE